MHFKTKCNGQLPCHLVVLLALAAMGIAGCDGQVEGLESMGAEGAVDNPFAAAQMAAAGESAEGPTSEDGGVGSVSLASTSVVFPICLSESGLGISYRDETAVFISHHLFHHNGRVTMEGHTFNYSGGLKHDPYSLQIYSFDLHTDRDTCRRSGQIQSVVMYIDEPTPPQTRSRFYLNGKMTIWRCESAGWGSWRTRADRRDWRARLGYGDGC